MLATFLVVALVAGAAGVYVRSHPATPVARGTTQGPVASAAFGKLPAPALHPPPPPTGMGLGAGGASGPTPYFGPAVLSWGGQLPAVPAIAPVFRFAEPGPAEADAFAARAGAVRAAPGAPGALPLPGARQYHGPDGFQLSIVLDDATAQQPTFVFVKPSGVPPTPAQPPGEAAFRAVAANFLGRLGLTPTWPSNVQLAQVQVEPAAAVDYRRIVRLSPTTVAPQVDGKGNPVAIEVQVDYSGQPFQVTGPLPVAEQSANYKLGSPQSALAAALAAPPLTSSTGPEGNPCADCKIPPVTLTSAQLVYVVIRHGGVGYLEPAYLFTGTFLLGGGSAEKRVLVPAISPDAIQP